MPRAIDCWVNTNMGDAVPPAFLKRVAEDYFKRADSIFKSFTPGELMNTRGKHKILFASDHPVRDFARCVAEAEQLPLRDGVLDRFLYENANQLFFSKGTS